MGYRHTNSKGVTYYLNCKEVSLRAGNKQTIYYFSRAELPDSCDLPPGMQVKENSQNGFLTLARSD